MSKTIIVSNRLPVKVYEEDGSFNIVTSEGGLATGLGSVYRSGDNVWLGWPGIEVADEAKQHQVKERLADFSLVPVFLTGDEISGYYEGFSNEILWPIFHYYASTYSNYKQSSWNCYSDVNKKFLAAVLEIAEPGDTIWIHDYQLLLLPGLVRNAMPDISIGFFLHIPFPSFEMFRLIPWRSELIEGMLGADLVGFHTFDDASHFINAATRLLPYNSSSNIITVDDRPVVVESFPMGIDDEKYASLTGTDKVIQEVEHLKETFKDKKLILCIDRLDYSKGILQRLQAFELLLETHPEYREKVVLHMIVVPSRDSVPQYKELKENIDRKVGDINARHRTIDWSPVNYFYRAFPIDTLSALYHAADICLVTPMRDGMNLVSKEYVASRTQETGVLILSEMAGASKELIDAIIVNPSDINMMAKAMVKALSMPVFEQRRRMKLMRQVVSKFNIKHWVRIFMERIKEVKQMQQSMRSRHITDVTEQAIKKIYNKTQNRIIFLDYDGTLVGFKSDINAAKPDEELYALLDDLSSDPTNQIVLVSGRDHNCLEEWFGNTRLTLVAEHGAWQKKNGEWESIPGLNDQWKQDVYPLLEMYVDRTPGAFIEEKNYSLVWHYRKVEKGLGELRTNELMNNLRYLINDRGLQLLPGNKVVEIKNIEINKGKATSAMLHNKEYDFIMALGDDHTDEDIFKALPDNSLTVKVGSNISAARFYLRNHHEVRHLLRSLVQPLPVTADK
ncbi:bifunctional alpha,alpha-trehalose-phosphate synthase (UDP-forming)/trehalose-phosphatase [Mucilaginibacter sp. UR6-1]|uniref:bifunctional alpha,alpha-trehalose-phosphate synthase (UDP-forming)/trehalose-phosphatase n=1 Tax=Mucilaginibacter sp. UR6-1 TaxID=1435643 RepID=UPI001E633160|nr:bifunctional alpha,alpha-trehalose-phosphate synthase (UDP-forming)/trehalose-phosphatase [Mucilaginibacter sp. UR6-1]MCC8410567.1 bifunctional alpha,alpha-trehalose-phosphate synthase (UDP-forming)/trehalose-phosphatase [Mucilaginibacter sp. UR6-1]